MSYTRRRFLAGVSIAFVSMLATCCTGHRDQGTATVTAINRSLPRQVRMYPSASITPTPTWTLV
jgi:hypothetical protein